jgi:cytochrome c peroxidase
MNSLATLRAGALSVAALLGTAAPVWAATELPQGWTSEDRVQWWNGPQGSLIMPYDWFLKIDRADASGMFAAPDNLAAYGFLHSVSGPLNPDSLPIGLSRETPRGSTIFVGMTCAACHTAVLGYQGKSALIEGAGSMLDTLGFDRDLSAALVATASDDGRFAAFASRLGAPEGERDALRTQLRAVAASRAAFTAMNKPPHDHGPGRADALGVIMNALTVTALDKPSNARAPDAPVRLPYVWNSPTYNRVQYNGSISNAGLGPLLRNIGQTLGVYGTVDISKPGYGSSVAVAELDKLEALLTKLQPPVWPDMLPPIDKAAATRGGAVFAQACAVCHAPTERDANRLLAITIVPLERVGTDPLAARNFMTRPADTGPLEGRPIAVFGGPVFGPRAGAATIVGHISTAVSAQVPRERLQAGLNTYRAALAASPARLDAYKAVPLNGAWSSAPYLHNGSVANLKELLTAPVSRATRFTVSGAEFDPVQVGYPATVRGQGFVLDTTLPGNSNAGHEYGTTLSDAEKADLIEYLKGL